PILHCRSTKSRHRSFCQGGGGLTLTFHLLLVGAIIGIACALISYLTLLSRTEKDLVRQMVVVRARKDETNDRP
ncbi:MAG: hypothetical protein ACP5R5_15080, partial [Armatimonadota bacterium]